MRCYSCFLAQVSGERLLLYMRIVLMFGYNEKKVSTVEDSPVQAPFCVFLAQDHGAGSSRRLEEESVCQGLSFNGLVRRIEFRQFCRGELSFEALLLHVSANIFKSIRRLDELSNVCHRWPVRQTIKASYQSCLASRIECAKQDAIKVTKHDPQLPMR